jgi:hypothetical protein
MTPSVIFHSKFVSYVPCRINESDHVLVESSIDRVNDGEFSESLHHGEQHGSDDNEANDLAKREKPLMLVVSLGKAGELHTKLPGPPLCSA